MIVTVGQLKEVLKDYDDSTKVSILFECSETNTQYEVAILTIAGTKNHVRLCHEEDYEGHYSKRKK